MAGKLGRPRKDVNRCNIIVGDEQRSIIMNSVMDLLQGIPVGNIDSLSPKAFVDLATFILGDNSGGKEESKETPLDLFGNNIVEMK